MKKLFLRCIVAALSVGALWLAPAATSASASTAHQRPTVPRGHGLYVFGALSIYSSPDTDQISLASPESWGPNSIWTWQTLEPTRNRYDWSALDNAINSARRAGKRVVVRVCTNCDGAFPATPDWFFALPHAQSYQTTYSAGAGIRLPVPSDPVFKREFGNFLTAFGHRYNGNPNVELIQSTAGGGLYGEQYMGDVLPAGWTADLQERTTKYWIDRWRSAFPRTDMTVMLNDLGGTLMPDVASYAVSKNFYLESNSPHLSQAMIDAYRKYQGQTKIFLEIENGGCVQNTMPGFQDLINEIYGYGFAIDYLSMCGVAFSDAPTDSYIKSTLIPMLRTNGPGGVSCRDRDRRWLYHCTIR